MVSDLKEKVVSSLVDNQLPCATAFDIAREMKASLRQVGDAANELKVRLVSCQLGCFQVKKSTHDDLQGAAPDQELAAKIKASLIEGHLPCAVAMKLASETGVTPRKIGDTATLEKIRIAKCQLGCF
ncbi:MAG: hypothetical protein HYX91_01945 [Chloroflexi bacterium]|nr:hypothetical protein [Chloroflexota bacterium]